MTEESYKHGLYITYNGLNRPALLFGVPIMGCIALMAGVLFICMPMFIAFGMTAGSIPAVMLLAIFIVLRLISENDPNAVFLMYLKIKGQTIYGFNRVVGIRG